MSSSSTTLHMERERPTLAVDVGSSPGASSSDESLATASTPTSTRTPCIRFAPLPETPVRKTRSLSMGVSARASMLKNQTPPSIPPPLPQYQLMQHPMQNGRYTSYGRPQNSYGPGGRAYGPGMLGTPWYTAPADDDVLTYKDLVKGAKMAASWFSSKKGVREKEKPGEEIEETMIEDVDEDIIFPTLRKQPSNGILRNTTCDGPITPFTLQHFASEADDDDEDQGGRQLRRRATMR